MTISFSCLYWLPEALPVLKLFLCSPSFAPRFLSVGREPMAAVVDMWICLMQGLWFFFFFYLGGRFFFSFIRLYRRCLDM